MQHFQKTSDGRFLQQRKAFEANTRGSNSTANADAQLLPLSSSSFRSSDEWEPLSEGWREVCCDHSLPAAAV